MRSTLIKEAFGVKFLIEIGILPSEDGIWKNMWRDKNEILSMKWNSVHGGEKNQAA